MVKSPSQLDSCTRHAPCLAALVMGLCLAIGSVVGSDEPPKQSTVAAAGTAEAFWSFRPLQAVALPTPSDESWCRTPIDRFVLAKLEERGIRPNPTIDRRKLIRRAYFDLIGLPPTPEAVEAFVHDPHPDAYGQLIDRLLDSPHYGERWGRHWLDLARFAESHGYEQDYDRPYAYHYRDFVIQALNRDMPYDQFVRWQIAGDEFAPDDPLAWMATGFLAAGTHATQITANQAEKERYDELDDMIRTVGTTMLGLTIGCARCHDHKFDPIPAAEYYQLISTFSTTVRSDYDVDLDPAWYRDEKRKFDDAHAPILAELQRFEREELPSRFDAWRRGDRKLSEQFPWLLCDFVDHKSTGGATFTRLDDGSVLASGKNADQDTYTLVVKTGDAAVRAIRIEALADPSLVGGGPGRAPNGNLGLTDLRVVAEPLAGGAPPAPVKLQHARSTFDQANLPVAHAIDERKDSCWAIDPAFGRDHAAVFEFESPVRFDGGTKLTVTLEFKCNKQHAIGRPRISVAADAAAACDAPLAGDTARTTLAKLDADPDAVLSDAERAAAVKAYAAIDPEWRKRATAVAEHAKSTPKPKVVKALVSSEGVPAVRLHTQGLDFYDPTHFLKRGDPNQKGDVATQGFLSVLVRGPEAANRWLEPPPQGCRTPYRRRALANWLTDVEHGAGHLLARVIVNRLWQHHLGRGIVATPSDFGKTGERPSHPELLDWLAAELIRNQWRLKPIHKKIMTSAVYMQSGLVDDARLAADRDNQLFWHRPARRLEAELIRDSILAVAGQLDPTMFGPGTLDPKHRRRSIYFFVKRSQLVPMITLFDGPDTLQDLPHRVPTTIAPQALMLMNNAILREHAESFARRVRAAAGTESAEQAVRVGYAIALGRPPSAEELADATQFFQQQAESYGSTGRGDAAELALADFCQALISLNEFVYVD